MCLDDRNHGRACVARSTTVVLTGGYQEIVPQDLRRQALIISGTPTTDLRLWWGSQPVAGQGVYVPAGTLPLILDTVRHGGMVVGPIFAQAVSGNVAISFTESLETQP